MLSLLLFSFISTQDSVSAASKLEVIAQKVSAEKEMLLQKEQQKRNILGELYSVNRDLKKLNAEKSKIEKGLRNANENVSALTQMIDQLDEKIKKQRARLRERMKALSKVQGQGIARLIFGSRNSAELDANTRIFRIVTEKDFRLLRNFKENLKIFAAQKAKLDYQEKRYASLKKKLDQQEKNLAGQMNKKNEVLKSIDTGRILHIAKLKKLRLQSTNSINNDEELKKIRVLEDLLRPQIFEKKGELQAPVSGKVTVRFGLIDDEESNTKIRFKGQLYQTSRGQSVRSVYAGAIAYAGWLDGYGRTIIVDHGDHYFTVYANTDLIEVNEGQSVSTGERIGYTSDNESFLGRGLYFEFRHFSEPENPQIWIKETGS